MKRKRVSKFAEGEVLTKARRRCAICYGLDRDAGIKRGQIAHIDRNSANSDQVNLVFLCLEHHDQYDSRPSQSKGMSPTEVLRYREELYSYIEEIYSRSRPSAEYKIFVIDDEPAVSELFKVYARRDGHSVQSVQLIEDIDLLMRIVGKFNPDCIVLDVEMGFLGANGIDIYLALRGKGFAGLILFYTKYASQPEFVRQMLNAGAELSEIVPKIEMADDYNKMVDIISAMRE